MTLSDVIGRLSEFNAHGTIYAAPPWTADSHAIVAAEPPSGGFPAEAAHLGLTYFLEVDVAGGFLEDLKQSLSDGTTERAICKRLIAYAVNDA